MDREIQTKEPAMVGSLAEEVTLLHSLPESVSKVRQLLESPYATNGEIGEIIGNDPALTARVLQLVNRGLGGGASAIETVSGAIALVGRESLARLLAATPAIDHFPGIPPEQVNMERFWLNSVACGVIARSLAFRCRLFHTEPFFVAGLLHKLGRLVFYSYCPDRYREVLALSENTEERLNAAELAVFGFTHAHLAAELFRRWGLPERLQVAVGCYPAPEEAPSYRKSTALIHVASALASRIEAAVNLGGAENGDDAGFEKGAWDILNLPLYHIPKILDEGWVQTFEISDSLRSDSL